MTAPLQPDALALRDRLTAVAIMTLMMCELLWLAFGWWGFRGSAFAAMILIVPLIGHRLGLREAYLLTFCAVLTSMTVRLHPDPLAVLYVAMEQATFLATFDLQSLRDLPELELAVSEADRETQTARV